VEPHFEEEARVGIENYRDTQSKKGGVLLLMLEAVITGLVFTISLKRNTQNRQL